jgi:hypothetical protein
VCAVQWLLKPQVDATGYKRRLYQVLISVLAFLALNTFPLFLYHKISENGLNSAPMDCGDLHDAVLISLVQNKEHKN